MVVNCGDYGGAGYAGAAVTSRHPLMGRVAAHELGHSFAGLADEYGGPGRYSGPEPSQVNITTVADPAQVKWREFVGREGVSTVEGGGYYDSGLWRPTHGSCMMRALQDQYCLVCRDAINRRIQSYAGGTGTQEPVPGPGPGPGLAGVPSSGGGGDGSDGVCSASTALPRRRLPLALLLGIAVVLFASRPRAAPRRAAEPAGIS